MAEQSLPITTDLRLLELQDNMSIGDTEGVDAIELFYDSEGGKWMPSGYHRTVYDPTGVFAAPKFSRLYCIFNKHVQQWHPVSFAGSSGFWVKLTERCERAYSGVKVVNKEDEWPITEWAQAEDPRIFDEDPYTLFDRNIFDVNGAACNVQGGIQPLVTRCWPGGMINIEDIEDQTCLPADVVLAMSEEESSSSQKSFPYYNIDLGVPNEADSERHNLYD